MFSNRIIVQINEGLPENNRVEANIGTQLLGVFAASASILSP